VGSLSYFFISTVLTVRQCRMPEREEERGTWKRNREAGSGLGWTKEIAKTKRVTERARENLWNFQSACCRVKLEYFLYWKACGLRAADEGEPY
jgi:hypothetical protein